MMAVGKQQQPAAGKNGISGRQHQRQATNREAQKRYRERQKARLLEMQVAIDSLTRQLAQHQKVQSQNLKLEVGDGSVATDWVGEAPLDCHGSSCPCGYRRLLQPSG